MTLTLHTFVIEPFIHMLQNLAYLIDRGAEKLDPAVMVGCRLAPDMYTFAQQVQIACFQAEDAIDYLTGRTPGKLEMPLEDVESLKRRIAATIGRLGEVTAEEFEGAESREYQRPLGPDLMMTVSGLQYLRDWSLPNFYFHVVTAYDILRNQGVAIGKPDYLRHIGPFVRAVG